MKFSNEKILITGAAGFIGSNLAHYFDENYPDTKVLALDIFRTGETFSNGNLKSFGHFKNLKGFSGEIVQADITKPEFRKILKKFKPDIIFHLAAISDTTVLDQAMMIETNLNTFKPLLEYCKKNNAKLIYASSGATYGDAKTPQTVWECENPNNVYGFSKLSMDYMAMRYIEEGVHVVGLRYFNVYGKGEFFKNTTASMVLQFGHQILAGVEPKLFEGSDKIFRDFVYIKDVVRANLKAVFAKKCGVYNVATGKSRSFQDIVDILQQELGTNLKCKYIKNPYKAYQYFTQANMEDSKKYLEFEAKYTLEEGIRDYLSEIVRLYKEEVNA